MAELRLTNVAKSFVPGNPVLDGISLAVRPGECVAVVGPSGCGKSTLLRVIAGLENPDSGEIRIEGHRVNEVSCHRRGVAMLFQRPALLANATVRQNLLWERSLRHPWGFLGPLVGKPKTGEAELLHLACALGLEGDLQRPVNQLSGGQQQRVALGRCLLQRSKLCLLDEPLGHLDAPLRTELRRRIRTLAAENAATLLFVTHDPAEALAVGDRAVVMQRGRIVQVDEPDSLRRRPATRFVAELLHHDRGGLTCVAGRLGKDAGRCWFDGPFGRWDLPGFPATDQVGVLNSTWHDAPRREQDNATGSGFHTHDAERRATLNLLGEGKFLRNAENSGSPPDIIHIIIGIAAEKVSCSGAKTPEADGVEVMLSVVRQEFCTNGSWVIGRDKNGHELIGRGEADERFRPGQEVIMRFSSRQMYGFDHATGETLWVAAG